MRNDLASIALRAVVGVMGQPVTYTRAGQAVPANGVFQRNHWAADEGTGLRVNSSQPVLLVNRQDLPWEPRKGDMVEVADEMFTVNDSQRDGHTGWLLLLHRLVSSETIGMIYADTIIRANTMITAGA